jgi:ketosteroid isomerase-like protein
VFHLSYLDRAGFLTLRLMPRRHLTIALVVVLAAGLLAACTTGYASQDAQSRTAARDSVIAAERAALDRWGRGEPQGFLDVYAPEITYFDPMQERRLDGIDAMKKLLLPLTGKIKVDRYEMIGTKVQQYGDVAVLSYNLNSHVTAPDGKPRVVQWNSSVVYVLQDRHWRSVHSHWSYVRPLGDFATP